VLRNVDLTPNQVWGLTKTDPDWAEALNAALTATRRNHLKHGTTAGYVAGCVCREFESTSASGWLRTAEASTLGWPARSGLATI
jgi:hypothetical protein